MERRYRRTGTRFMTELANDDTFVPIAARGGYLSQAQLEAWARYYAADDDTAETGVWDAAEWLVFRAGGESFTLPIASLDEIAAVHGGVMLPHQPAALLGLINLRGETVLLADLARVLGLPGITARDPNQRALLFRDQSGRRTAFLVEAIETVANFDPADFQERVSADEADAGAIEALGELNGVTVGRINVARLLNGLGDWLSR